MSAVAWSEETVQVAGTPVHYYCGGEGPPLLVLHGLDPNPAWLACHQALATHFRVYAPTHPGFGRTPLVPWMRRVSDLTLFYLWLLEEMGLERVLLLGHGLGGWVAADLAITCPHLVERLVLVDAAGVKPPHGEILDVFLLPWPEVQAALVATPTPEWQRHFGATSTPEEEERWETVLVALARLSWKPYLYDPRLPHVLPRLRCPTLIVWGREDRLLPLACGELYRERIAASRLVVLEACGHYPHVEQPQAFLEAVVPFLRPN
ncbi:MAG: hydrolase [Candidatus Tectimicrobiota bacterium]|nr:MAG: hydrolase [Candidatus Tectomicrobia bacterium]